MVVCWVGWGQEGFLEEVPFQLRPIVVGGFGTMKPQGWSLERLKVKDSRCFWSSRRSLSMSMPEGHRVLVSFILRVERRASSSPDCALRNRMGVAGVIEDRGRQI